MEPLVCEMTESPLSRDLPDTLRLSAAVASRMMRNALPMALITASALFLLRVEKTWHT